MPVTNVNLMGPNPAQPMDLQTQQAQLAIAQQMAQQLINQSMREQQPGFLAGEGPFARYIPNLGGAISRAIEGYRGNQQLEDVQKQQAELARELGRRDVATGQEYLKARTGSEGEKLPEGMGSTPDVPPDILKAIQIAQGSQIPRWQAIAAKDIGELPSMQDVLKYGDKFDPASLSKAYTTLRAGDLKPPKKLEVHDNVIYKSQGGELTAPPSAGQTFGPVQQVAPGVAGQPSDVTGKVSYAPVGTAPVAYEKEYGAAVTKKLLDSNKEYIEAGNRMGLVAQIKTDLANIKPEELGTLAGFRNATKRAFEMLGATPDPRINNVEGLQQQLGQLMLEHIRLLAPVTKEDVAQMQKIVGTEGMTKRGLEHAMEVLQAVTQRGIERHLTFVNAMPVPAGYTKEQHIQMWAPDIQPEKAVVLPATPKTKDYRNMNDEELRKYIYGR